MREKGCGSVRSRKQGGSGRSWGRESITRIQLLRKNYFKKKKERVMIPTDKKLYAKKKGVYFSLWSMDYFQVFI